MDEREDRCIGADSQGQRQHCHGTEQGRFTEGAEGVAEICLQVHTRYTANAPKGYQVVTNCKWCYVVRPFVTLNLGRGRCEIIGAPTSKLHALHVENDAERRFRHFPHGGPLHTEAPCQLIRFCSQPRGGARYYGPG